MLAILAMLARNSALCVAAGGSAPPNPLRCAPWGVSREWGDKDGSDMTSRAVSGWGIADEMGFAVGRNGD